MKYAAVLCLVPVLAMADARVHLDTQACHVPWDVNTDNEAKFSSCDASLNERAGVVTAWANERRFDVPSWAVPVVPINRGKGNKIVCASAEVRNIGACSVTDDDGNAYSTGIWRAVTKVCTQKKQVGFGFDVSYQVVCSKATRNQ